jgi:hypothetical protein
VLSEKRNAFLSLLKNKGFKEERMTKVGLDAIDKSTTLESNKSHEECRDRLHNGPDERQSRVGRNVCIASVDSSMW